MPSSTFTKPSNVKRTFTIDWRPSVVQAWARATPFKVNDIVRAPTGTGFYYKCTTAGISSAAVPDWKREAAQTMKDGSIVWTVFHPDAAGLFTIATSVWTVDAGITESAAAVPIDGFYTNVDLDDGVDGKQYRAIGDIVLSNGKEYQDSFILGIEDPAPL